MGERERILELVREGVLSVEEALDLLESVAKRESKETEEREFTSDRPVEEPVDVEEPVMPEMEEPIVDEKPETEADVEKEASRRKFETELENLANEINRYSVEIDSINEELTEIKLELADTEDELHDRKEAMNEEYFETKKELEKEIINLQKEIELISTMDEIDYYNEVASLNKELTRAMEDLKALENEALTDEELKELEEKVDALRKEVQVQTDIKNDRLKELHALKMKQWTTKAKQASENIDIPEEWREGANKTFNKAGDIFEETSKTIGNVFRQTLRTTKDALDNIDWKDIDINLNIPRGERVEFDHEWLFEDTTATILDFKNANGDIQFKPSMNENIKITAKIKIRGDIAEATPLEAFEASSVIKIDEDKFTFHVPNKKITADMMVYLPQREYDYIRSNTFNGDVSFKDLHTRDIYVKSTNGEILLNNIQASMLEVKGTNGDITLKDAELRDLLINTVNGDLRVVGYVQSSDVNTTNGTVRLTLIGEDLIRVAGSSINGDVKVSLPKEVGLEVDAKTTFGKIKSRLSNTDSTQDVAVKGRTQHFRRVGTGEICRVNLQTTTGNVLLKDTDKGTETNVDSEEE